ncbi:M23 family metallopeptidase [Helicobacter sp. NHP22-001]|uniref:M23 family metallopeptidase n=1 Tax=Helicobacter sp. NHP22-001 TaxID=3040202 RepID=UPI00244D87E5|nr:M23 family metallopeptidase [Helicobacter sp. NHP22-001]GMB95670.1 ToxR-activated protein TagE [Helicobacter sp. NHP22-001]
MWLNKRLILIFTYNDGSKTLNIPIVCKQLAYYLLLLVVGVLLFLAIALYTLEHEIHATKVQTKKLNRKYQKSTQVHAQLNQQLQGYLEEIMLAGDRINDLEDFVGIDNSQGDDDAPLSQRLDVASITGMQKTFIMRFIPNDNPLESFKRVSSTFAKRYHPILHRMANHTGVDLSTPIGTPVYATANGVVGFAGRGWNGGYGRLLKLYHPFGFKTYYAHLKRIVVKNGEFVKKGQLIAYSGSSGMSTGPHLHYEVRFLNKPINPMDFIKWNMKDFDFIFTKERNIAWQSLLTIINNLLMDQPPSSPKAPSSKAN